MSDAEMKDQIWVRKRTYTRGPEYTVRGTPPNQENYGDYFQVVPKSKLDDAAKLLQEAFDTINEWEHKLPEGVALEFSEKALASGFVKKREED